MNLSDSPTNDSLLELKQAFDQWRQTRTHRGRTPDDLRERVLRLSQKHTIGELRKTLGIGSDTLKEWCAQNEVNAKSESGFVALPNEATTSPNSTQAGSLRFTLPNGVQVNTETRYTLAELMGVLSTLESGA